MKILTEDQNILFSEYLKAKEHLKTFIYEVSKLKSYNKESIKKLACKFILHTKLQDVKNEITENELFIFGFSGSHFWLHYKPDNKRILLITE